MSDSASKISYGWKHAEPEYSVQYTVSPLINILRNHNVESVLDLGCGNGGLTAELADNGFKTVGCDRDAQGIQIAQQQHRNLDFYEATFQELPGRFNRKFDAVISTEVIEHLYNPAEMLRCAHQMLKADGVLVVTTPHYGICKQLAIVQEASGKSTTRPLVLEVISSFFPRKRWLKYCPRMASIASR